MRVACIHSSVVPSRAANSIQIMKMAHAIAQEGHQVLLVVPSMKPGQEPNVADVFSFYGVSPLVRLVRAPWLPIKGRGVIFAILAVLRAWLFRPDVVYTRYARAGYLAALFGLNVIYESHAPENGRAYSRMLRSRNLIRVVAISSALRAYLIKTHQLPGEKVIVAHDGADCIGSGVVGRSKDGFDVGYAGHLYEGKGMELISELIRRCGWARFHIIGGRQKEIAYWKERTAGASNVTFYGFVPNKEVHGLLVTMDALVAPYQPRVMSAMGQDIAQWMSPLKIFEYMDAGVPIVASDLPVLREILRDRFNALLCDPLSADAWVAALEELRDDAELAMSLARTARQDLEERYTWRQRARAILQGLTKTIVVRKNIAS